MEQPEDTGRHLRHRNLALLLVLFGLAGLVFAVTVVKLSSIGVAN